MCAAANTARTSQKLSYKADTLRILEKQLQFRVKKEQYGFVVLSSATDPYMPVDEEMGLTRGMLALFAKYHFPVHVITKSDRVLRDIDLLEEIDTHAILPDDLKNSVGRGCIISFSISSLDTELTKRIEPGAPAPQERLEAMQKLSEAGFLTGLSAMPLLPFLSDSAEQIEALFQMAQKHKAHYMFVAGMTLFGSKPGDSKTMFYAYLQKYHPHLVAEYKRLYRIFPFPPKEYQEKIGKIAEKFHVQYGVRNRIYK